jgi:gamma-glutamylcyclotransferase (GGCT)/AIG2-like uncharacterized protein YtfP
MTRIFVYGSLMSGERIHDALKGSIMVGPGKIQGALFNLGPYPAVLLPNEVPTVMKRTCGEVHGEIYECKPSTIQRLDQIEGHPVYYERKPVKELMTGMEVWVYTFNIGTLPKTAKLLFNGMWSGRNPGVMQYA